MRSLLFTVVLWSCGGSETPTTPTPPAAPPAHDHAKMLAEQAAAGQDHAAMGHDHAAMGHAPLPADEPVRDTSIYQLPVALTASTGAAAELGAWKGHPVLVSMIYTSCTAACPMIISEMSAVEAALSPATRERMRYLLVSMDPERDTPAALADLAKRHNLDDRWLLARTDEDGVRQISAVLGIRYRKLADGNYNHSAVLTLLDEQGVIAERIDGLGKPNEALVARAEVLGGTARAP